MKVFAHEITLAATLYILAESKEEADAKADAFNQEGGTGIEFSNRRQQVADDLFVTGETFSPDMPELSLSPAMTIQYSPTRASCWESDDLGTDEEESGE